MSDRRHFSSQDMKSLGARIKSCRVLTELTQEEFSKKYNISYDSLKAWEFGRVIPKLENLKSFVEQLSLCGIYVEVDWILFREGTGPAYFLGNESRILEKKKESSSPNIISYFKADCNKNNRNPIIAVVEDEEMELFFKNGDIISGVLSGRQNLKEIKTAEDGYRLEPMLALQPNGKYAVRWVHFTEDDVYVSSIRKPNIVKLKTISIARICLHIKENVPS